MYRSNSANLNITKSIIIRTLAFGGLMSDKYKSYEAISENCKTLKKNSVTFIAYRIIGLVVVQPFNQMPSV